MKLRGLSSAGNKPVLLARLRKGLADKEQIGVVAEKTATTSKKKASNALAAAFPSIAHWQPLVVLKDIMAEPENPTFSKPHAPTIEIDQAAFVPIKHNFTATFERPDFKSEYEVFDRGRNGRIKLDKDRKPTRVKNPQKNGRIDPAFVMQHKLSTRSSPVEFMATFLPFKENHYSTASTKELSSFSLFAKWTNLKASLAGAGEGGACYHDWRFFRQENLGSTLGCTYSMVWHHHQE